MNFRNLTLNYYYFKPSKKKVNFFKITLYQNSLKIRVTLNRTLISFAKKHVYIPVLI